MKYNNDDRNDISQPDNEMELFPNGVSRRGFLQGTAMAFSSILFGSVLYSLLVESASAATNLFKTKACILLWMDGGPSQIDTWDPKPGRETGGSFKAIPTSVPGIHISEHLPGMAQQMKKIAIIRSVTTGEGNHQRARYYLHTGFKPFDKIRHPSLGSIVSSKPGNPKVDLPQFITIGNPSFGAGYLGIKHEPNYISDPTTLVEPFSSYCNMISPTGMKWLNPHSLKTFNLDEEPDSLRDAYGRNAFGAGCLLARRLVESGVRFVEVTLPGWDTHQDNFHKTKSLLSELDPAFSTLIRDLENRGLLQETLILCMGEFGRTPKINSNAGRDHYPKAWSMVMAGGGIQGGRVIGETDADGYEIKSRPVMIPDLFKSIAQCLGIDGSKTYYTPQGKPITLVDNGLSIKELFA